LARSPISVSKFRNNFFGWWIVWAILHTLLVMSYGYSLNNAAIDSIVTNSLLLAACWIISNILRYYLPYSDRYWYVLFLSIIFSLVVNALSKFILNLLLSDPVNTNYLIFLSNAYWIRLGIAFLLVGCMAIICVLWYTQEEEQENPQGLHLPCYMRESHVLILLVNTWRQWISTERQCEKRISAARRLDMVWDPTRKHPEFS